MSDLVIGAVAYDPKVVTIWTGFSDWFLRHDFGFDYVLECYVPAAKRRYGYFTLAILRRGAVVGRLEYDVTAEPRRVWIPWSKRNR